MSKTPFRDLPPGLASPTQPPVVYLPDLPAEHPWERQPRESDTAWALFQAWRECAYPEGAGGTYAVRSLQAFAQAGGWDLRQIRNIAESHDWNNRSALFDRMIDARKTAVTVADALPQVLAEHRRMLGQLRKLVAQELDKWLTLSLTAAEPQTKLRDLARLLEMGVKLDRLTHGEATEVIKLDGAWDVSGESLESLKELRAMAERCGGSVATAGDPATVH